jgi:hypothetical protein
VRCERSRWCRRPGVGRELAVGQSIDERLADIAIERGDVRSARVDVADRRAGIRLREIGDHRRTGVMSGNVVGGHRVGE